MKPTNNSPNRSKQRDFSTYLYEGKPLPTWLHRPAYGSMSEDKKSELPDWLRQPVKF